MKQIYDGTKAGHLTLDSSQTTATENWTIGVKSCDYLECSEQTNSSEIFIEADDTPDVYNPEWKDNLTNITTI